MVDIQLEVLWVSTVCLLLVNCNMVWIGQRHIRRKGVRATPWVAGVLTFIMFLADEAFSGKYLVRYSVNSSPIDLGLCILLLLLPIPVLIGMLWPTIRRRLWFSQ